MTNVSGRRRGTEFLLINSQEVDGRRSEDVTSDGGVCAGIVGKEGGPVT